MLFQASRRQLGLPLSSRCRLPVVFQTILSLTQKPSHTALKVPRNPKVRVALVSASATLPPPTWGPVETLTNELRELKQHLKDANSDLEVLKTARLEAEQTYKALAQELEVGDLLSPEPSVGRSNFARQNARRPVDANCFSPIQTIETHEKRVVVLIDGDGTVFLPTLIAEGEQGGHEAASRLTTGIESYVGDQQSELHVYVFLKKSDLTSALKCHGHNNSSDKLDEFIMGFNEAYNLFSMVDVGAKKTADNKIRGAHLFLP